MYLFILSSMKKYILTAIIVASLAQVSIAQDYKIGIRLAPTLSLSRTASDGNSTAVGRNGSSVRFLIGAFVDVPFKENYYFQGGVNFASKITGITLEDPGVSGGGPVGERYDHEFLQVPLLLKLYTNEVMLDTRIFFNFGMIPEIRLNTDNNDILAPSITAFRSFDLAGNFGGGVERSIGVNTRVYAGLNYNIGFLDQVKTQNPAYDDFTVKSNLFSLELGIKF